MKRREEAAQEAVAARREEADRIFARLKAEKEAAAAAQEREEFLVNLLHQEEKEAQARAREAQRAAHQVCLPCLRACREPARTACALILASLLVQHEMVV